MITNAMILFMFSHCPVSTVLYFIGPNTYTLQVHLLNFEALLEAPLIQTT